MKEMYYVCQNIYNMNKIRQEITRKAEFLSKIISSSALAKEIGVTPPTLRSRLSGASDWKIGEASIIDELYTTETNKLPKP